MTGKQESSVWGQSLQMNIYRKVEHTNMKAEQTFFRLFIFFIVSTSVLTVAVGKTEGMREALNRAGGNRGELETALRKLKGKDTEYLISHASQYDLVNLTVQEIIENVTYARKVHELLPYLGEKLEYGLWREWVLPYRVLDEELGLWRKDFHQRMQPVIEGKKTTKQVADAIIGWMWVPDELGATRVRFGSAEHRIKSPVQVLEMREGACAELNLVYVSLLRSVGIPARVCHVGWWYHRDNRHFYAEYWDCQLKQWTAVDASDDMALRSLTPPMRFASGTWNSLMLYAQPSYPAKSDLINTWNWEECIEVSGNVVTTDFIRISGAGHVGGITGAGVWNTGTWRSIASSREVGDLVIFHFCKAKPIPRPVLYTRIREGVLAWALKQPTAGGEAVILEVAESGKSLSWNGRAP